MNCLRLLRAVHRPHIIFRVPAAASANFTNNPLKFAEFQQRWRENDGVPEKWQLVYKAPMDKVLNYLSCYLTVTSATITVGLIYYATFIYDVSTKDDPVVMGGNVVIANSGTECLVYLGSFILLHAAVKVLLSKYVIRLYQNDDNYIAIYRGHFLNSIKKHEFHLNDVKKLKQLMTITWSDARFSLGKKKGILLENYFKTPHHFNYLIFKRKSDNPNTED